MFSAEEKGIIELQWRSVQGKLKRIFGKVPDLNAALFLIGMQELGMVKKKFSKEQKQDLMHIAICKLLSQEGYYQLVAYDHEGWPHFEPTQKLPQLKVEDQEDLLKKNIVEYFDKTDL